MVKENYLRLWQKYYSKNNYYHKALENLNLFLVPPDSSVLQFSSRGGETLSKLPNKLKIGIEYYDELLAYSQKKFPRINFFHLKDLNKIKYKKIDYILFSHTFSDVSDVHKLINISKKFTHQESRVIVYYFNYFWKPFLDLGEKVGLKIPSSKQPNWLSEMDIDNLFYLENFQKIKSDKKFLFPYELPYISPFFNKFIANLPIINNFCLINYCIYQPIKRKKNYSVSIIIPARNEMGNMKGVLKKIPKLGSKTEVIFVEGHSTDGTYKTIKEEIKKYKGPFKVSLWKQKGKGKADAVWLGFKKARNDLLMILDADLTVAPSDLKKFYDAFKNGKCDFVMGSRLVYPMEAQAMRNLNVLGNKFFSFTFSYLLGQKIKDTLCGTKVILKKDYIKIKKQREYFGDFDPFGDFELIFGASKLNLKIIEIPIRYKDRVYGKTNISRFRHGLILLQMVVVAAKKMKFI